MEVWKNIEFTNGMYSVSNFGNVKSHSRKVNTKHGYRLTTEKIMKNQKHPCGYFFVRFGDNLGQKLIHRLVAESFIKNPYDKEFVNHKNGIKTDNRVENLEWVTRQENEDHAFATGLKKSFGEFSNSAKLKNWQVFYIKYCGANMPSKYLGLKYGVDRATIQRIWNKKIWTHI